MQVRLFVRAISAATRAAHLRRCRDADVAVILWRCGHSHGDPTRPLIAGEARIRESVEEAGTLGIDSGLWHYPDPRHLDSALERLEEAGEGWRPRVIVHDAEKPWRGTGPGGVHTFDAQARELVARTAELFPGVPQQLTSYGVLPADFPAEGFEGVAEIGPQYQSVGLETMLSGLGGWRKRLPAPAYHPCAGLWKKSADGNAAKGASELRSHFAEHMQLSPRSIALWSQAWWRAHHGPVVRELAG